MPEVEKTRVVQAPLDVVWDFCKDMDNWASFLRGYVGHRAVSESESEWTLKGDVGVLAKTTEFRVTIDEWIEKEKVSFTLKGITDPLGGRGTVIVAPLCSSDRMLPVQRGWWPFHTFAKWIRRFPRRKKAGYSGQEEFGVIAVHATSVSVKLSLSAGGMTGPMYNALIAPMLGSVADELAEKLTSRIEELYSVSDLTISDV